MARLSVVIDQQHPQPIQRLRSGDSLGTTEDKLIGRHSKQGKRHGKSRTFANAFTFCRDGAAMKLNQMPDNSQAQPQAAKASSSRTIRLAKPIEDARQELRIYSLARISHGQLGIRPVLFYAN